MAHQDLTEAALEAALTQLTGLRTTIGLNPTTLIVPPSLADRARIIIGTLRLPRPPEDWKAGYRAARREYYSAVTGGLRFPT